jgi:hypothetical protein
MHTQIQVLVRLFSPSRQLVQTIWEGSCSKTRAVVLGGNITEKIHALTLAHRQNHL